MYNKLLILIEPLFGISPSPKSNNIDNLSKILDDMDAFKIVFDSGLQEME